MSITNPLLTFIYLAAAIINAFAASIIWQRRKVHGARSLALMVMAAAFWALCDAIELQAATVGGKRFVSQWQYFGIVSTGPLFFHAAFTLSQLESRVTRAVLAAVWGVPLLTLALAWTSSWHGWLWQSITISPDGANIGIYHYGWWFWIFTAHYYLVMSVATLVLLSAGRRVAQPYRAPLFVVLIAILLPWAGNIAYIFKLGPWPGLNYLSISIGISGILLAWDVVRGGLFDLLPRARAALLDGMSDGVVVLDRSNRILLANPAAREIFALDGGSEREAKCVEALREAESARGQIEIPGEEKQARRSLEVRANTIYDRRGEVAGRLFVIRDQTERKALEEEREALILKLEEAVSTVRKLEELLPICASCKKIRDDNGYWDQIEEYLGSRLAVQFSHGLCPDCMEKLYSQSHRPKS